MRDNRSGIIGTFWPVFLLVLLIIGAALFLGLKNFNSEGDKNTSASAAGSSSNDLPANIGLPADYFPTEAGCRWEYEITYGIAEPLQYRIIDWPTAENKVLRQAVRSRFMGKILRDQDQNTQGKKFKLAYSIKGPVSKAGPFAWNPVQLNIEQDDAGVYKNAKDVFFVRTHDYALAMVVETFSPDSLGAPSNDWGHWGQEEGYSAQLVFFVERPMTQKSLVDSDTLLFLGSDGNQLHYRREVVAEKRDDGDKSGLGNGFIEDAWYEKGKGLTKLEQRINGEVSMTWQLKVFSKS